MIGIKDFKMPKGCGDCACYDVEWARCSFVNKSAENIDKRLAECPLVAEVVPVKRGIWHWDSDEGHYYCSECKKYVYEIGEVLSGYYKSCPWCGAKMDGKENE